MARPKIKRMRLKHKAYKQRKALRTKTESLAQRAMRLAEAYEKVTGSEWIVKKNY